MSLEQYFSNLKQMFFRVNFSMQQYKNKTLNCGNRITSSAIFGLNLHLEAGLGKRAPSKEPIFSSITLDIRSELVLSESLMTLLNAMRSREWGREENILSKQ